MCGEAAELEAKEETVGSHPGYELLEKEEDEDNGMDAATTIWSSVLGKDGGDEH